MLVRFSSIDDYGQRLNADESGKKVDRNRNKVISESKHRRVINALVELAMADNDFKIDSFIS